MDWSWPAGGLRTGVVSDVDEIIPYGGGPQPFKAWEKDLPMREALLQHQRVVLRGSEGHDLEAVDMARRHVERARADGAGGAEDGEAFHRARYNARGRPVTAAVADAPAQILVVDDDKAICEYMETFLAKDGFEGARSCYVSLPAEQGMFEIAVEWFGDRPAEAQYAGQAG